MLPPQPLAFLHPLDHLVIACYLLITLYLGYRAGRGAQTEEGFFLAGRKLGRVYQFFLNLGNATDANSAASTASLVYQQGVSGVWLSFQLIFLNPYYWFMNLWFRRARLVTTGDLFAERLASRGLSVVYSVFQVFATVMVVVGFGNLATYKISSALVVKPEIEWTTTERSAIEGYRELQFLEKQRNAGPLNEAKEQRLQQLRALAERGELRSHITKLNPVAFYITYTLVVGVYMILGGMAATAINEVFQSLLILTFSVILIPTGLSAIGGWSSLGEHLPAAVFELISSQQDGQVTGPVLLAILLAALVQINGIIGNMGISGSATDENAVRWGAVAGTYVKRVLTIMWVFCGLIALVLFRDQEALADPDSTWGALSLRLLGPGLLGLMVVGVLAANMSTVAAQTMAIAALVVRNLFRHVRPDADDRTALLVGRWTIAVVLAIGVAAALSMDDIFAAVQLLQTINIPFGATVLLIFFWRRLTAPAVWVTITLCATCNIIGPLLASKLEPIRTCPTLLVRSTGPDGRHRPVFFDSVVPVSPDAPQGPLVGRGRFHSELFFLHSAGVDVSAMSSSNRFAARFLFDALSPFALLIGVSLFTRQTDQRRLDQFYGRLKTPVGSTPLAEAEAIRETRRNPGRFDHLKLFPHSNWEFTRWDRTDAAGFLVCLMISGGILVGFWMLLGWAARGAAAG